MTARDLVARAILLVGLTLLAGCVSFVWSRRTSYRPMADGSLAGLEPGTTKLDACLDRLGAPLYVWEYKGNGAALAWGFGDRESKRIAVSIPLERANPSVNYADVDASVKGAVLLFDDRLVLEQVKEGYLRALARELRKPRPAPSEGAGSGSAAPEPVPGAESKP